MRGRKAATLFIIFIILIIIYPKMVCTAASSEDKTNLSVLIDLSEERLYLIDSKDNKILKSYIIASGKPDTPSPIGSWKVISLGKWSGGFGSRWIGLNVPWGKYGIHGTNKPSSIGSEASHGCIRMSNNNIEELYDYIQHGTTVVICTEPFGAFDKGLKILKPGDRGSAVYEVQKKMKDRGYYPGHVDGIYGENMKKYVLKFRVDNKLSYNHYIDKEFYKKLDIELID